MKKYIFALFILLVLSAALTAKAQTAGRVRKQPNFFVPEKTLQQTHKAEKLPTAQQMLQHAQRSAELDDSDNSLYSESASTTLSAQPYQPQQPRKKMKTQSAPIDDILKKQPIGEYSKEQYKKNILTSYYLLPRELKEILQKEADSINADTKRMIAIKNNWKTQSPAFKFANYRLNAQISAEMTQTVKNFKNRKKKFDELLKKAPPGKRIAIIEATDPIFWHISNQKNNKSISSYNVTGQKVSQPLHYVSVFDHNFDHLFSYHRKHINLSKNRRIAASQSGNPKIDKIYQNLFDSYLADLGRISSGLDINNPILLRQIGEMQNKTVSESY